MLVRDSSALLGLQLPQCQQSQRFRGPLQPPTPCHVGRPPCVPRSAKEVPQKGQRDTELGGCWKKPGPSPCRCWAGGFG